MHDPRNGIGLLRDELEQRRTSGYDVGDLDEVVTSATSDNGIVGGDALHLERLMELVEATTRPAWWPYEEPSTQELRVAESAAAGPRAAPIDLQARLHGAWLGRCAGCVLGKPIEGWSLSEVRAFLEEYASWPPTDYLPAPEPWPESSPAPKPSWPIATRGRISGMPRDDDLDYTILGLHLIEQHGRTFTTEDVAEELLDHLPFTQVFTAERVVYRNLVAGLPWTQAAAWRNPYREWIGALIRADIFGYISPGDPAGAAAMALRDARLTHDANGVYGAMWTAAAIAAALGGASPRQVVEAGLAHVPVRSRLHEAIEATLAVHEDGLTWSDAISRLGVDFGQYHWVHVIPNTVAIVAAVLWGAGDFGRTIGLAVAAGRDTDSTGATAGSLAGAMLGSAGIPARWTAPLADTVRSSIAGFDGASIEGLVKRTLGLATGSRAEAVAEDR